MSSAAKSSILVLTDGKAGHETQTQGFIQLLNQNHEYEVEWLNIHLPTKFHHQFIRFLLKYTTPLNALKYFIDPAQLKKISEQPIRFIVSAGGNTLVANALLKSYLFKQHPQRNIQNIIVSSLRGVPAYFYDLVFTIHESQKDLPAYLYYPIAPNKMTASELTQCQAREKLNIANDAQVIAILLGADTKSVKIGSVEHWVNALAHIRQKFPTATLLVSSSRRCSVHFEEQLNLEAIKQQVFLAQDQIVWVAQGQTVDIKNFIQAADWVLVSPDSTSMVAEVVMAEKKLVVLEAEQMTDQTIQQQLNFLQQQHYLALWNGQNVQKLDQLLTPLKPIDHTHRFSSLLQAHLNTATTTNDGK